MKVVLVYYPPNQTKKGISVKKSSLAVLLTLLSANAIADETNNWDGLYGSVLIGYTDGDVKEKDGLSTYINDDNSFNSEYLHYGNGKASMSGISGNFKIGYNKQIANNNLIGLELGATFQEADSKRSMYNAYTELDDNSFNNTDDLANPLSIKTKIKNYQTLALRFGHIFNEDTLVYGLVGGAVGRVERNLTQLVSTFWFDENYSTKERKTETGYVLGLGVEHKINTKVALRASYEYVNFGNIKMTYNGPYNDLLNSMNQSHKIDFSNLSVGLTYQF